MQLFYNPHIDEHTQRITFDRAESNHIIRVLRKKINEPLLITDGKGLLITAGISIASDKQCVAEVTNIEKKDKTWKHSVHIAMAPTKSMDRFEWFLEKATEIGIDVITPILCEHSERKVVKQERLEKIVESAMKQSLSYYLPRLNPLTTFQDFIASEQTGRHFIAHCYPADKRHLKELIDTNKRITILIGPEGDFSSAEIEEALKQKYIPISLGDTRLRTETAGIVALTTVAVSAI